MIQLSRYPITILPDCYAAQISLTFLNCQRRLKADPHWREVAEVKLTHRTLFGQGEREGDLPPRYSVELSRLRSNLTAGNIACRSER